MKVETNMDEVVKKLAKLDDSVAKAFMGSLKKKITSLAQDELPKAKAISPVKTGKLRNSVKVKTRSRKGALIAKIVWGEIYAYILNNYDYENKENKNLKFINKGFDAIQKQLDEKGQVEIINEVNRLFAEIMEK